MATKTIHDFKTAMLDAGITPPDYIIGDGNLHRFHIDGDKSGSLNGWYKLHLDGRAAGSFGSWKQDIKVCWKLDGEFKRLTDAEKKAFAIERQRQADERQTQAAAHVANAKRKAAYIWSRSIPATDHPYLTKKRIQPHMARLYKDALVIPMLDASAVLVSLQFIAGDGAKTMMSGGIAKGSFCFIGTLESGGTILICEGFATGASLHEHSGEFVVAAFSAGNLEAVARAIRKEYPSNDIIICGDNDESGAGQKAARAAALAIGGKYILPSEIGTDFNDQLTAGMV